MGCLHTYLLRLGAIKNIYGRLHMTVLNATYGIFRMLHRAHLKEYKGTSQVGDTLGLFMGLYKGLFKDYIGGYLGTI